MFLILIWILISIYFGFIRNIQVFKYRRSLSDRCYRICTGYIDSIPNEEYTLEKQAYTKELNRIWDAILDIPYEKMLFQFWKPLKDRYWLTKEQQKFLNLKF